MFDITILRPNRVAEGTSFGVFDAAISSWPLVIIVVAAALLVLASGIQGTGPSAAAPPQEAGTLERQTKRVRAIARRAIGPLLLLWAIAITVLPWVLFRMSGQALSAAGRVGELARLSPGGAVWLGLISALAAWHELLRSTAGREKAAVVALLLGSLLAVGLELADPALERVSYFVEYAVRSERFVQEFFQHIRLSGSAVAFAFAIGVPAGMAAYRFPRLREAILDATSTIQTIPSLAMFGLLIAPLAALSRAVPALRAMGVSGVGTTPALIALTLYALLPIVRNTLTGLSVVPKSVRESGRAMGMTGRQRFWLVEVPLALPVLLRGVRTSAVQAIGNTTVAGLIGAGGLGWFIFQGLGQAATDLVVLGVIPIVLLAVAADRVFQALQRWSDRGRRRSSE